MFYDSTDPISNGIGTEVRTAMGLAETELKGFRTFASHDIQLVDVKQKIIFTDRIVKMFDADLMIFLSRHRSADGVKAFTVHPTGNWSGSADYGGTPKTLSVAAPHFMAGMLRELSKANKMDFEVTYEATHHGPITETPSLFVEAGGPEIIDSRAYKVVSEAIAGAIFGENSVGEVVVGIGSGHYPRKFTKEALDSRYAISHMMPKYQSENIDMLEAAVNRSRPSADKVLIEWNGLKGSQRSAILEKLEEIGIDYIRI